MKALTDWIDGFPVWGVVATAFVLGTLLGIVLRFARKGKYEDKERGAAEA